MSNIIPSSPVPSWTPPQAKIVSRVVIGIGGFIALALASFGVVKVAPTMIDATELLTTLLTNWIYLGGVVAVLGLVWFLVYETFRTGGSINKLFRMQWESMINKATWAIIEIDPLSPFYERQKEVRARKATLADASARIDGIIRRFDETGNRYMKESQKHEGEARGAQGRIADNPRMKVMFETSSQAFKKTREMAQEMYAMRDRLIPVQQRTYELVDAAEVIDKNLDLDIRIAREKWDARKAMEDVNNAGRAIFSASEKAELADKAQQLIDTKYSDQLGALDNLMRTTQPMLDSIDLERATASEELLTQWQRESAVLIEGPKTAAIQDMSGSYANLIR